jgi:hypothetical protein
LLFGSARPLDGLEIAARDEAQKPVEIAVREAQQRSGIV